MMTRRWMELVHLDDRARLKALADERVGVIDAMRDGAEKLVALGDRDLALTLAEAASRMAQEHAKDLAEFHRRERRLKGLEG